MNPIPDYMVPIIIAAVIWSTVWKAMALWHAAKKGNKIWFIILLLVNSLGALEAFYLFYVEKVKTNRLFK